MVRRAHFRVSAWLAGLLLAAAASAQTPPTRSVPLPKVIIQLGHSSSVDAAAWLADKPGWGAYPRLITADAADNAVILWWTAMGIVVDRVPIPMLDSHGLYEAQSVRSLAMDAERRVARLVVEGLTRNADNSSAAALFTFDFDTFARTFTRVGAPQPVGDGDPKITYISEEANRPLPAAPGGTAKLRRDGSTIIVEPANGLRPVVLGRLARDYTATVDMAPGGDQMAILRYAEAPGHDGWRIEARAWSARSGRLAPAFSASIDYNRVRWLDTGRFALFAAGDGYPWNGGKLPTLVIDAGSGAQAGAIPARCMTTPVGSEGLFAGAGPASCGATPSAADGLWLFRRTPSAATGFTLERGWARLDIPELKDAIVSAITAYLDTDTGKQVVMVATRSQRAVNGRYKTRIIAVRLQGDSVSSIVNSGGPDIEDDGWEGQQPGFQKVAEATDRSALVLHVGTRLAVVPLGGIAQAPISADVRNAYPEIMGSDGHSAIFAARDFQYIQRFDVKTGQRLPSIAVPGGVLNGGFIDGLPVFWAVSRDAALRLWDSRTGALLLTYFRFPGDGFFVFRPDGRYDTNLGADTDAVRWLMPDATWQALPAQTLMRSHYTPALFQMQIGCITAGCGPDIFPPLPDVSGLNRLRPETRISAIVPGPGRDEVTVNVSVSEPTASAAPQRNITAGRHDLRLFRNERLVAERPDRLLTRQIAASDTLWQQATELASARPEDNPTDKRCEPLVEPGAITQCFVVPLPSGTKPVAFSSYAFNSDRIKGETARRIHVPLAPVPPRRRRAFVIAIGVDATDNPAWRLNYAANDAHAVLAALAGLPGRDVIGIELTSTDAANNATKANIAAVLKHLNGFAEPADSAALVRIGIDPARLTRVTPDDIVILSFSGHGINADGEFYMVPSDAQRSADGKPLLGSLMSSLELTQWARHVDAGEMAMIIDACHSAASVGDAGFKPGPMGDPGLGQLAFDKGIRILAATQADNVAMEDGKLGHGLLTYALVIDGLKPGRGDILAADRNRDGTLKLDEWLNYAVERLPVLADEIASGNLRLQSAPVAAGARMIENFDDPTPAHNRKVQEPKLFDFSTIDSPVVVRGNDEGQQ